MIILLTDSEQNARAAKSIANDGEMITPLTAKLPKPTTGDHRVVLFDLSSDHIIQRWGRGAAIVALLEKADLIQSLESIEFIIQENHPDVSILTIANQTIEILKLQHNHECQARVVYDPYYDKILIKPEADTSAWTVYGVDLSDKPADIAVTLENMDAYKTTVLSHGSGLYEWLNKASIRTVNPEDVCPRTAFTSS